MQSNKRIEIIDALRGFSLAGIVIVHIVEQYIGGPAPAHLAETANLGLPDTIVSTFIEIFLRGKFFALFSLLFGLSFFIQFDNAAQKNEDYKLRYLWRIFLLFMIGYIHHCFYRGDILTIYAVLAPFLLLLYPLNNKWLWAVVGIIFLGLPRVLLLLATGDQSVFGGPMMMSDTEGTEAYWDILKNGNLFEVLVANGTDGLKMKMEFQLGVLYRFYLTFAFFIIGMWLGRIQFFQRFEHFKGRIKKSLYWAIGGVFLFAVFTGLAFSQMGTEFSFGNPWAVAGLHMADMVNICLTIIILCGFVLFYHTRRGEKTLGVFTEYGRTALTNYVAQTLIGTFLLFGWGLGLIGEGRNHYLFGIAIFIIALQIIISKAWLKKFRYGPLEWIWRSATYGKWM